MQPERILVIRLDRIGDVILSTPVIKVLREKFPESFIAFMVGPHAYTLVKGNPYLDEVIVYDKKSIHKGMFSTIRFALSLRQKNFDLALILHPTSRSHIISFIAGIPRRIGYDRKMPFLLTDRLPHEKQKGELHEADYALSMLKVLGIDSCDKSLYLKVDEDSFNKMKEILNSFGIKGSDSIVTIHPGASCPSKRWPLERFAEIADYLIDNFSVKAVIVSGPEDADYARNIFKFIKNKAADLCGKTSIQELASILKMSSLFVSNDSGPVHIAVALGTPVISIFGRSDKGLGPKRWGPLGKDDVAIHKNVGCRVCLAHNCINNFKCLQAVAVEDIVEAVLKFKHKFTAKQ